MSEISSSMWIGVPTSLIDGRRRRSSAGDGKHAVVLRTVRGELTRTNRKGRCRRYRLRARGEGGRRSWCGLQRGKVRSVRGRWSDPSLSVARKGLSKRRLRCCLRSRRLRFLRWLSC